MKQGNLVWSGKHDECVGTGALVGVNECKVEDTMTHY